MVCAYAAPSTRRGARRLSAAKSRRNAARWPGRVRLGGGAAHADRGRQAPRTPGARAEVQAQRRAPGRVTERRLGVHGRSACSTLGRRVPVQPMVVECGARRSRAPPGALEARRPRDSPRAVCAGQRQRAHTLGPGGCRPCLGHGVAPRGRGLAGRPDGRCGPRRRRQPRPSGEARGRFWGRRCPSVARRLPAPRCPGGTRRPKPVPWGSGRAGGVRRAARAGASGRYRARVATQTGGGHPGVGRC
jgi:hypothetical protein